MAFDEQIAKLWNNVRLVELAILIWGPGSDPLDQHYLKRQKLRETVKNTFPNCDVQFSESIDLSAAVPGGSTLPSSTQEFWHLAVSDMCVVLDTAKGPGEEIAYFAKSPYAHKLLILTHEKYGDVPSFPSSVRSGLNQLMYTDNDYESCELVASVVGRLAHLALLKLIGRNLSIIGSA